MKNLKEKQHICVRYLKLRTKFLKKYRIFFFKKKSIFQACITYIFRI